LEGGVGGEGEAEGPRVRKERRSGEGEEAVEGAEVGEEAERVAPEAFTVAPEEPELGEAMGELGGPAEVAPGLEAVAEDPAGALADGGGGVAGEVLAGGDGGAVDEVEGGHELAGSEGAEA